MKLVIKKGGVPKKAKKITVVSATVTAAKRTVGFGNRKYNAAAGPGLDTKYLPGTDIKPTFRMHVNRRWKATPHLRKIREFARYGKGKVSINTTNTPKPRTFQKQDGLRSEPVGTKLNAKLEKLRSSRKWFPVGGNFPADDANHGTYIW